MEDPLIICRTYSCIADVLGYMGGEGGIRAGPAANVAWRTAFVLLEKGNFHAATRALATERAHWIKGLGHSPLCFISLKELSYTHMHVHSLTHIHTHSHTVDQIASSEPLVITRKLARF